MAKNSLEKNIRQIEILGLCSAIHISKPDLEEAYAVSEDLIKRDISDMRTEGIAISSRSKKRIEIDNLDSFLKDKITFYLRLRSFDTISEKAIDSMIDVLGSRALYYLVAIYKQIEHSRPLSLSYTENGYKINSLEPLSIWYGNDDYRMIARSDGRIKQYSIKKISAIDFAEQFYSHQDCHNLQDFLKICNVKNNSDVDELTRFSWGGWVGTDKIHVTITLSGNMKDSVLLAEQARITGDGKSNVVKGFVNSLPEFAKYIAAHHPSIKALDPPALVDDVKRTAANVSKYYRKLSSKYVKIG